MGVLDKIKNLFYDVEVVDIPKENTEEVKVKEEIEVEKKDEMDDVVSERDLLKSETTFKFPVIFEDEDFKDMEEEPKKKISENKTRETKNTNKYQKPKLDREVIREVMEKPKKFTPSPIISPVYGLLDKDTNKKIDNKNSSKSLEQTKEMVINFDTIRQKAYGSLTDDIENELNSNKNDIDEIEEEINSILEENSLLSDLEDEEDESTKAKEELESYEEENTDEYNYSDFGVEYKLDNKDDKKSKKKEIKEKDVEKQENVEKTKDEKDKNEKDVELSEDLFNLIDSMYDR